MKFFFPLSNLRTLLSRVLEKNIQDYFQNSKPTKIFCQEMIFGKCLFLSIPYNNEGISP
jgi:hypothetical protein